MPGYDYWMNAANVACLLHCNSPRILTFTWRTRRRINCLLCTAKALLQAAVARVRRVRYTASHRHSCYGRITHER